MRAAPERASIRIGRRWLALAVALWPAMAAAQTAAPAAPAETVPNITLPTVDIIATSPLPGIGIDRDKVPANVETLPVPSRATLGLPTLANDLEQRLGSVNLNQNEDNPFQPNVQYRGFEATSVVGTPIGLAVYQNGVRLNEPFGDSVSWDLIPDFAVNRVSVMPTNPIFGLNALGGALVLDMKNGFNSDGTQIEASGGSFGRRQFTVQTAQRQGDFGLYLGGNLANDEGFRKLSPAGVRQLYADFGAEGNRGSLHLSLTGANNVIDGLGPTPIQQVDIDRTAVFASPQTFRDTLLMTSLNGNYLVTDDLSLQSNLYMRSSGRRSYAGNIGDERSCDPRLGSILCFGDPFTPLISTAGTTVPNIYNGAPLGENDVSSIAAMGLGASLQATYTARLFGHGNHLVAGASIDHGDVNFNSHNELATIASANLVSQGTGIVIAQPDGSLTPIGLETTNSYYGVYASDTFDLTDKLSLSLGGRYNIALIHLIDKLGTALNGNNRYSRFNPAAGLTYKILPGVTAYAGYAEANRTPTAGELGCSDPTRPCSLDAFVSADPPGLKQVVAHSYEAGLRGKTTLAGGDEAGRIEWNLGFFRTDLDDDILAVPSAILSTGFFENVGNTRRQGIELGIGYKNRTWNVGASYSLVDATFQSPVQLSSPSSPTADANGDIQVMPGDHLPGIPQHRIKLNADYSVTDKWTVGGNVIFASDQYYFGDEANQNPQLPGYVVVNIHTSYRVTDNLELFAVIDNLFDNKYATYGIFNNPTTIPLPGVPNPSDPRFVSVAPPLAAFGGVRIRF